MQRRPRYGIWLPDWHDEKVKKENREQLDVKKTKIMEKMNGKLVVHETLMQMYDEECSKHPNVTEERLNALMHMRKVYLDLEQGHRVEITLANALKYIEGQLQELSFDADRISAPDIVENVLLNIKNYDN